eukprot:6617226-Prymnesium_polylepis.2
MSAANRLLWLRLRNTPILQQLRLEEALFRADKRSWFVTNEWDAAPAAQGPDPRAAEAIVLGISGKVAEMVEGEHAARAEIPVIKRFTGGGTIVCDAQTLFASFIIAEGALPLVQPYPDPILQWTGEVYDEALRACGVSDFRVNANDYCIGQLKFGGNAQAISGKRWLHHTSLLWRFEPERMRLLKMPPRQPEYRKGRSHGDFVRGLSDSVADRDGFCAALAAAVAARLPLDEVPLAEAEAVAQLPHRAVTRLVDLGASG